MASWKLAPTLVQLLKEVNADWPLRDKTSDGTIGNAAHAATVSDHNPDQRGVVCAVDIDEDLTQPAGKAPSFREGQGARALVNRLLELVRAGKLPQLHYIVYERQIFSATKKGPDGKFWSPNPYSGVNAHDHHVHVSVFHEPNLADRTNPWNLKEPPMPPTPPVQQQAPVTDKLGAIGAFLTWDGIKSYRADEGFITGATWLARMLHTLESIDQTLKGK